ncbi:uncharacterized protein LOC132320330 [Gavia stellata]|uniref:uncharacterized protein LOC132320330 n=1 Tax=Gavia stellata TaxID=37040 RepID=UPI00289B9519|nr:uncharacterized protein LOC132320330 [Gavia stellata]
MQAEAVKQDLRMLRERLAQCSAETQRHKEMLRCLGKKQQELQKTMDELSVENCDVARSFENHHQELKQLEGLVAQMKGLRQEIKKLEEAQAQEEACQQQRKKEAEAPGTVLPEASEAQLERDMPSRRRGFINWLRRLCLLLVGLQLAVGFSLAAAVLYASWYDPKLFYRLLLRMLPEETYAHLAYAQGKILPVVSEGLLPF